jgi:hypothetical protein
MSRLDAFRAMTAADVIECLAEDPSVLGAWQKEIEEVLALLEGGRPLVARLNAAKDRAYAERNLCVALIARMADHLSTQDPAFGAWLAKHDPADTAWERDWLNIVFVRIPTGQLSWHLHDSEVGLFDFLPRAWDCTHDGFTPWDGHTTEQKYDRIRAALKAGGLEL